MRRPAFALAQCAAAWILVLASCGGPKLGPPPSSAARLNAEAVRRLTRGDDAGASELAHRALHEAELLDDLAGQAEAWNNLGALAMARGDSKRARAAHLTALSLYRALPPQLGEVRTHANLGAAMLATGERAAAKAQFEAAVALGVRLGDSGAARLALVGLAVVALGEGDARGALALARQVTDESAPKAQDESETQDGARAGAWAAEGAAYESLGAWDDARRCHDRALDIDRQRGAAPSVREDLRSLARVAERNGQPVESALYLQRSARVAKSLGDRVGARADLTRALALVGDGPHRGELVEEAKALSDDVEPANAGITGVR